MPQDKRKGEKIQVPKEPSISYEQLKDQNKLLKHNMEQLALTALSGAVQLKDYGFRIQQIADAIEQFFPPQIKQQLMRVLQQTAQDIDQKTGITPDESAQPAPANSTDYEKAKAEAIKKLEAEGGQKPQEQPAPA